MSIPGFWKKPLVLLIIGSILLRVVVYLLLPPAIPMEQHEETELLFFSALADHFSEYLSFITLIPPASYAITASVIMVLGIKTALHVRAFLILAAVMDIAAVAILFQTARSTGIQTRIAWVLMGLFSIILLPFELWREGMHYDHHTIFFTSCFACSLVLFIRKSSSLLSVFLVSLSGGLLVTQSAVNSAVVPASILLISFLLYFPKKQYRKLGFALAGCLFLPFLFLALISTKNTLVGSESLTSNKAGPAMMMVVQRAYNYDADKVRDFAKESGAPGWYLWAYDHATIPDDPITGKPADGWLNLSQAFGVCFLIPSVKESNNPFGFDFHPLLNYLRTDKETKGFIGQVEADSSDLAIKPYLFAGYSPVLSSRWISVYGDISKKLFYKALIKEPIGMLKSFIVQQGIFSIYGCLFPYNIMRKETNLLVRSGLRTLPGKIPLDPLFAFSTIMYAAIAGITYIVALLNIPLAFVRWIRNRRKSVVPISENYFLLMGIPLLLLAIVFSCLVGGENDRYFMQVSPYIVLLAAWLPGSYKNMRNREVKSIN